MTNELVTQPTSATFCSACGKPVDPRAELCMSCGVRRSPEGAAGAKSRTTAGIFALLLGGLGVHHFYMGRPGRGILYVLFCWTFIPAIIALVEGILYLTKTDAEFAAKYG